MMNQNPKFFRWNGKLNTLFTYTLYLSEFELLNYRRDLYMVAHWRMSLQYTWEAARHAHVGIGKSMWFHANMLVNDGRAPAKVQSTSLAGEETWFGESHFTCEGGEEAWFGASVIGGMIWSERAFDAPDDSSGDFEPCPEVIQLTKAHRNVPKWRVWLVNLSWMVRKLAFSNQPVQQISLYMLGKNTSMPNRGLTI